MRRAVRTPDSPSRAALTLAAREGATPVGVFRYGLNARRDVGLAVAGTAAELAFRQALPLDAAGQGHLLVAISPMIRWVRGTDPESTTGTAPPASGDAVAIAVGGQLPLLLTRTFSGVYDLWGGLRVGVEHARGRVGGERTSATVYRAGAVVGVGLGFKTVAVLMEVAADYEHVDFEREGRGSVSDLVLTPAFALRIRL
jgi:hypothetical protein